MTEDIFVFKMCVDYRIGHLRMSSDSPSLDDKGADDDVSLCVSMGSLASG